MSQPRRSHGRSTPQPAVRLARVCLRIDDAFARVVLADRLHPRLAALQSELATTAQRGYAIDRGEHEANYYCIGAPIFDRRGQAIAACSVSGTDPTIAGGRLDEIAAQVVQTTQEISRYMGYVPPRRAVVAPLPALPIASDGPA